MRIVYGEHRWRRHFRCTSVWILRSAMSRIPHPRMMMEDLLDQSVVNCNQQLRPGNHVMLSQQKPFSNVLNQQSFSKLSRADTALQLFGPAFKTNTVVLSIMNTFEPITNT